MTKVSTLETARTQREMFVIIKCWVLCDNAHLLEAMHDILLKRFKYKLFDWLENSTIRFD